MKQALARAVDGELLLDPGMARHVPHRRADVLTVVLVAIALLAVLVPTLVVVSGVGRRGYRDVVLLPRRVVPQDEVPPVEPVKLVDLTPDAARAFNAGQPFSHDPVPAARPFHFAGDEAGRARATDCLAAAAIYEAGDDIAGERAVAQVVLNRLRHPAFPKSVCAVVFEGSERSTGCQFTFACDGALARWRPSDAGWRRAREVAAAALAGSVDKDVGYATHYHTDWVVPYWQSSLDKIAAVHTHLFFRWSGWWGTPPAFNRQPTGPEPVIALLATLSPAHGAAAGTIDLDGAVTPGVPFFGKALRPLLNDPDTFLTALDPAQPLESYRVLATQACGDRARCKVFGWTDVSAMAFTTPLTPEAQAALSFSYLRDKAGGFDRALWNCSEFPKAPPGSCMKRVAQPHAASALDTGPASKLISEESSDELGGVRRKSAPAPTPSPSPVKPPQTPPAAMP
jgi:hypothetical protein